MKKYLILAAFSALLWALFLNLPSIAGDSGRTIDLDENTASRTRVYPPYTYYPYYPPGYYPEYPADTYYRRALDQYKQQMDTRIADIEQDLAAISQDVSASLDQIRSGQASMQQVLIKLDKIESSIGNLQGRLKKLEENINRQNGVIRRLQKKYDPNSLSPSDANSDRQ